MGGKVFLPLGDSVSNEILIFLLSAQPKESLFQRINFDERALQLGGGNQSTKLRMSNFLRVLFQSKQLFIIGKDIANKKTPAVKFTYRVCTF